MEQRIPKIIHYCWFGGNPKPKLVLDCIESWKKYCPDYEIIEWNESNFDVHSNAFAEEAYCAKKWAFVSDFARANCLYRQGGIYLDTDMELICTLDNLLNVPFFAGFEVRDIIATGIIGCERENEIVKQYLQYYQETLFDPVRGDAHTSPVVLTRILEKHGVKLNGKKQNLLDCAIYPKPVFYPTGLGWVFGKKSSKTIGIHHYMDSWNKNMGMNERSALSKLRLCILYHARSILGTGTMYRLGQRINAKKRDL